MKNQLVLNTISRDVRLINFAGKTVKTVKFISAAVGVAAAAVTVMDIVRIIKK